LKSDCPKYKLVYKTTGVEKHPFDKSKVGFQRAIKKSVHEISSELPLGGDVTEINGTFPDAKVDDNDGMDIVDMAKQFISVLNLEDDHEDDEDDDSSASPMPYSFIASMTEYMDVDYTGPVSIVLRMNTLHPNVRCMWLMRILCERHALCLAM